MIGRDELTCPYYTEGWKSKSELLFVLRLMRTSLFRAAINRLLKSSDGAPDSLHSLLLLTLLYWKSGNDESDRSSRLSFPLVTQQQQQWSAAGFLEMCV